MRTTAHWREMTRLQPNKIYSYRQMPVNVSAKDVLVRLGAARSRDEALRQYAKQALSSLLPGGCMRLVPVKVTDFGAEISGHFIQSRKLSAYLAGCEMAIVMLSTLYGEVTETIREAFLHNRADEAVLLDAAASEAADAGLDFLMQDARRMLRPFGKTVLARRFSPGYADCSIEHQKTLLGILGEETLGVTLTDSYMLQPEKSVLAIGGVVNV
jgi:hypothetical protein